MGILFKKMQRKLLLSFAILVFIHLSAFGQASTTISIDPAIATVSLAESFTVRVHVDIATTGSINAVSAYLNFDRSRLQVTNITRPNSALFNTEAVPLPADYTVMNGAGAGGGQINYQAAINPGSTSTDFDILEITFVSTLGGVTPLTLNTTFPRITRVALNGVPVAGPPVNAPINGSVNISSCVLPNVTISNTPTCNGQAFNLVLASSSTGTGPFDVVINGSTYTDIPVGGTITTVTPPTERVFPSNPTPATPFLNQSGGVEVGNKFRASVPGFIKGVRFYRPNTAGGTYTGKLYAKTPGEETGTLLASATFAAGPGGQWQEVLFSAPVQIAANQTYMVTYYTPQGNYATTDGYFFSSGVTNGSLTALEDGVDGFNGMYRLGGQGYPNNTWMSANYFVDVLFTANSSTYNLTSVTDATSCTNIGALQTLSVNSVDCAALPVTLLNLSATPQGRNIILRWGTASEFDNKGFEIQRKASGGGNWEGIAFVNGAGNSSERIDYTYTDANLFPRQYNYRLKQVDIDGKYEYSMTVSAEIEGKADYNLGQNYPNPFRLVTTIQYTLPEASKVNLTVYDMNGRVVKVMVNEKRDAGTHAENLHTGSLPPGMYYYKIQAGSFTDAKKLVLQ